MYIVIPQIKTHGNIPHGFSRIFYKNLCRIPRPLLAGSFVVEIPLYPDLSIESRGTVILREFGLIRNENAAFLGFLGAMLVHHIGEGDNLGSYSGFERKNSDKSQLAII